MKFSIIATSLIALVGSAIASPVASSQDVNARDVDIPTLSPRDITPIEGVLAKRAPIGTLKTWTSNPNSACTGTPGQTITNPGSGVCYTHGSSSQTFVRALWQGNNCEVSFYENTSCSGTPRSNGVTSNLCWNGGWAFKSFKLIC
ncbi:hypothetical protein QBC38DRAFT_492857 [Podospora fimiseda]|uniref:Uncharacterized protein n=1 Tax=Podospora fimiseda TaxID=252190 RepID=A0AAN6YKM7_9PEZI|nr:hypothetical protein QBC38DRAFT_492857 [Podospora fimiseda]